MKKMTVSFMLATLITLVTISVPTIFAASNGDTSTLESTEGTKTGLPEICTHEETGGITLYESHVKMNIFGIEHTFRKGGHRYGGRLENIDEKTRAAILEIRSQLKSGDLTNQEAQAKVDALGLDLDVKILSRRLYQELSDEQKLQLNAIREQVKAGILTKEEAREMLKELGLKQHSSQRKNFQPEKAPSEDTETQATNTTTEA